MNDNVNVISTINGSVSINLPDMRFRRVWPQKGARIAIDKATLQECIYDPGVSYMFENGILYIEDLEEKKQLGLEPETATEPQNIIVLNDKQMRRLMTVAPVSELKETLAKMSKEQAKNLVDFAINNRLTDADRCQVLKDVTGINVLSAVILEEKNKED
jgi:hypothetical protein